MPIDNDNIISGFKNLTVRFSSFENPLTASIVTTIAIILLLVYIFYGTECEIESKKIIKLLISIFCIVFASFFINNMLIGRSSPKSQNEEAATQYLQNKTPVVYQGGNMPIFD
jgi:Na+(H+)/acetate symporter ActP